MRDARDDDPLEIRHDLLEGLALFRSVIRKGCGDLAGCELPGRTG